MKYFIILLTLFTSGCALTVEHRHQVDVTSNVVSDNYNLNEFNLNQTNSSNEVEYLNCNSEALSQLSNLEKIDVGFYKERNDANGLLRAAFERIKIQNMLIDIAKREVNKCMLKKE